ncbi:MAG TPA: prolyl oligopeptidase family serine peptidase [Streptosporangiaceae bacterium]|nr:prolyl oligopeptidase family serine peptidase [Streptosporangiaceae bacterium]
MADYQDFLPAERLSGFDMSLSLSADGMMVAYSSDASGQFNLQVRPVSGAPAQQLTSFTGQAVREAAWSPDGRQVAFIADTNGDEQYQVYLIPAEGGTPRLLSRGSGQHFLAEKAPFSARSGSLLCHGPDDDPQVTDAIAYDPASGTEARWPGKARSLGFTIGISPDGRYVLTGIMGSNTDCHCGLALAGAPGTHAENVTEGLPGEYYYPGPWAGDGSAFYVRTTDADHDHVSLARFAVEERTLEIVASPAWNVEDVVVSADGRTVIWSVNEDGCSVLHGRRGGAPLRLPQLPLGVVSVMSICADGTVLALLLDAPEHPASVALVRPGTDEPVRYVTDTRPAFARAGARLAVPELVRFPAGDGTPISGWLYRPPGAGPFPVVLSVHGGPESQERPSYSPLHQSLVASGIAVLAPNIRGSSGYGHAWQIRIYRDWGGIDLSDLAATRSWIAAQPWADDRRVGVYGRSYGGFAALSCLTRLPDLWAAGVSVCGMSNLETLARSMPPSWAGAVAAQFGDLSSPADVEDMRLRSPLAYASQITAPMLVLQGANDPRVPQAESDQIVAAARANGAEVRYEVFPDEGHGFTSRSNNIKAHQMIVDFLAEHLLS